MISPESGTPKSRPAITPGSPLKDLPAWAAKLAVAIFCADFLTMLLMNVFRLHTEWLPFLFFALLTAACIWMVRGRFLLEFAGSHFSAREQRWLALLALGLGVLFACARLPYLLEGHLHHLVGPVVYDDTWHFQEINSLVNSLRYPAQCSLIPHHYFSFYYAPWMLVAALYLAFPVKGFTIKAAFAIGCAIYQILICLSLLHIGMARARTRRQLYWAIYLVGFWAGLESFFALLYYLLRNPAWMLVSTTPIHLPVFAMGMFWAVHHISAAVALLLCWHIWESSEKNRWQTVPCCSLLVAYGFYSSVFVFLGALPLLALVLALDWRARWKQIVVGAFLTAAIVWPLLWLYLGKTTDVRFLFPFMSGVASLFPIAAGPDSGLFLSRVRGLWAGSVVFFVFLVFNFLPYAIALAFYGKKLRWKNFGFALIAVGFLISTYFIGFPEGDNYASRGYLVPIFVLGWICSGLLPSVRLSGLAIAALCLGAFGAAHESIQTYRSAVHIARTPQAGKFSGEILAINRDRTTRAAPAGDWDTGTNSIYDVEKFVVGGKTERVTADRQLVCLGPRGAWSWQQIPDAPASRTARAASSRQISVPGPPRLTMAP